MDPMTLVGLLLKTQIGQYVLAYFGIMAVIYVLVMKFKNKRDSEGGLEWYEWLFVLPLLVIGYPMDVIGNVFLSIVMLEPPKAWTISGRIDRYLTDEKYHDGSLINRWRMSIARPLGRFLNKYDPGHVG